MVLGGRGVEGLLAAGVERGLVEDGLLEDGLLEAGLLEAGDADDAVDTDVD